MTRRCDTQSIFLKSNVESDEDDFDMQGNNGGGVRKAAATMGYDQHDDRCGPRKVDDDYEGSPNSGARRVPNAKVRGITSMGMYSDRMGTDDDVTMTRNDGARGGTRQFPSPPNLRARKGGNWNTRSFGGKGSGKGKGWSSGGGGYRGSRQTTMSPSGVVKVILKPNAGGSGSSSRKGGKGGGKGYRNYGK
ncbi:hypothetical protein Pmar_PMAR006263 [Perkinsus marinus ATCC 50983]|uniref:Uncharacterized protein n=1 Tax=Perkinsus marinus (strain ATCC 50983 / TXsc) TaxID=423536 RepID=C5LAJ6_PERM5|nr:hypothetical protein Pmar_PMAR006263 [Perkinsus marinus ATCC 50983]EER06452.1 hypothetical protein Pmar_PMAR006263 [Perkinsus marinus ATCC 50983]|eukprot:XP_002774636.1 hypothetical protein Pmar_PMAR006263 [Perkinsus marinus ATCC 50983]